jgi:hypothetical protein
MLPNLTLRMVFGRLKKSSGHIPDLFLALCLLPVSRNAFFSKYLRIPPSVSIRYHQLIGNMFFLVSLLHGGIVFYSYTLRDGVNPWEKLFNWSKIDSFFSWTAKDWRVPSGTLAFTILLLIRVFSLPIIRRKMYDLFMTTHLLFPIPMVVVCCLHAKTNYILAFPALVLYLLDLILRCITYMRSPLSVLTMEPCGIVRIEVKDTFTKINLGHKNGIFYDIHAKGISKLFSHPVRYLLIYIVLLVLRMMGLSCSMLTKVRNHPGRVGLKL